MPDLPRVFGWASDSSACGWYRIELPLREYVRRGGHAEWSTEMPRSATTDADVIVGQRVARPDASQVWQALCQQGRALMVLELDDDLWNIDTSNVSAARVYTPELLANLERNIAAADVVTVTTDVLAERVSRWSHNVRVVSNRIPEWLLSHQRAVRDRLTIGWGGGASHASDWTDAGPQVGRFLKRHPQVGVHLIGCVFPPMLSWPRDQVKHTQWCDSVNDYYRLLDFDIGLAPLKASVFGRSKSNLRLLELAALGIPVVADNNGPYEDQLLHGVRGFLVRQDHEWATYLHRLAQDPVLRAEMSANGREWAAGHTVEGNLGDWLTAWQVDALVDA